MLGVPPALRLFHVVAEVRAVRTLKMVLVAYYRISFFGPFLVDDEKRLVMEDDATRTIFRPHERWSLGLYHEIALLVFAGGVQVRALTSQPVLAFLTEEYAPDLRHPSRVRMF